MTASNVDERVRAIVQRISPKVPAGFSGACDLYRELGVKSVAALELLLSLEEEFSIEIGDEDFGRARTVEAMSALIARLLARETAA